MKKFITLSLFIFITCYGLPALAQTQKLTINEAVLGKGTTLAPKSLNQLCWLPNQSFLFSYVKNDSLFIENQRSRKRDFILSMEQLRNISGNKNLTTFPHLQWTSPEEILFTIGRKTFIYNIHSLQLTKSLFLPEEASRLDYFGKKGKLAYTYQNNLFVASNKETVSISDERNKEISYGQAVHRNEFGIEKGTFWSPSGNLLAFYRMDETMVKNYPLIDYMHPVAISKNIKYPMAGDSSHQVKVGVYDLITKKTVYLKTGAPLDHYLTNLSWSPDEKSIILLELNREQDHLKANLYDATTGDLIRTIFEETDKAYVEPLNPPLFSKVNPGIFYYQSRRDGYNHIYQCSTDGKLFKQITKGDWEVTKLLGFDTKEQNLFIESTEAGPLERQIYRVKLSSGKETRITTDEGIHAATLSPDGSALIDQFQGPTVPNEISLIKTNGSLIRTLIKSDDPLKNYQLGENKLVTIKAADGKTDLYGRIILPPNFDPKKKYPVIVYVYGGPHSQLVNKSWLNSAMLWQYYMADRGFIAFTLDNRGTSYRGSAFETVIHRHLGVNETADQMKGIEYLKSLPYVDSNRIGVHGWSFGGFMTLNLMLRHPETFKVGVAGGPVVDWKMYEVMYGERYMDTPQENPEGYRDANMCLKADNLVGKLLLIHGMQDSTVVMQHNILFLESCIIRGKQVDFFPYPTHEHNVRGKDRIHLMNKVSEYFEEHL